MTSFDSATSFERELQDALAQAGAEVIAAPPLELSEPSALGRPHAVRPGRLAGGPGRLAGGRTRWLAPVAAAAAVVAIIAGSTVVARLHADSQPGSATAAVPRYFLYAPGPLQGRGSPHRRPLTRTGLYATRTGKLVAPVTLPPGSAYGITAAADDRTFAVITGPGAGGALVPSDRDKISLVKFTGTKAGIIALPPAQSSFQLGTFRGFALSPDGKKLAIAQLGPRGSNSQLLTVLNLPTGSTRTWSARVLTINSPDGFTGDLTWASDDRTLAFGWVQQRANPHALTSGLYTLDTAQPGSSLVSSSHRQVPFTSHRGLADVAGLVLGQIDLTPDGTRAVAAVDTRNLKKSGVATLALGTGRVISTYLRPVVRSDLPGPDFSVVPTEVLWSDATGSTVIVWSPASYPQRVGILRGGSLTLLPPAVRFADGHAAW